MHTINEGHRLQNAHSHKFIKHHCLQNVYHQNLRAIFFILISNSDPTFAHFTLLIDMIVAIAAIVVMVMVVAVVLMVVVELVVVVECEQ